MLHIYILDHWSFWAATARNLFGHSTIHTMTAFGIHMSTMYHRVLCIAFLPAMQWQRSMRECVCSVNVCVCWPKMLFGMGRHLIEVLNYSTLTVSMCTARKLSYYDKTCDSLLVHKTEYTTRTELHVVWKLRLFPLKREKARENSYRVQNVV